MSNNPARPKLDQSNATDQTRREDGVPVMLHSDPTGPMPANDQRALDNVQAALELAREAVAELEARARTVQLHNRPLLDQPAVVVEMPLPAPMPLPLPDRALAALLERSLSVSDLARHLGEPIGLVVASVKALSNARKIHNVGSADAPRYTTIIGDGTNNDVLQPLIERLIRDQPMYTTELMAATGARESRVSGAIIALQRTRPGMLNLGGASKGRWFLLPDNAKSAALPAKRRKRRQRRS